LRETHPPPIALSLSLSLSLTNPFSISSFNLRLSEMAGHKIAHANLKGPSVVKEIIIGSVLALAAGSL
jgi:hypothetical protein